MGSISMPCRNLVSRRLFLSGAFVLIAALLTIGPVHATLSAVVRIVLEKGRHYDPTEIFLHRGDTIILVNGDRGAVHHAFIEADQFSFDAGDQEPGREVRLTLKEPGDFVVQCGLHPKMRMTLHVE